MAKQKRALWPLAIFLAVSLSLTTFIIVTFGSGHKYRALTKPIWFPPLWFIHVASLASSVLMSFAGWLVWADGGFHGQSEALPLYIAQVSLSVVWDPLVLVIGSVRVGLLFCVLQLGTLVLCCIRFGEVNSLARRFVKPCLLWMLFFTIVNYNLIFIKK